MSQTVIEIEKQDFIKSLVVRNDNMSARIVVSKPPRSAIAKTKKDIITLLASNGISYGVLDQTIELIFDQELYDQEVEVARGISVVNGSDSHLVRIYHQQAPKEVDINLDPNLVSKDDVVFEVVPATLGSHGITIFGHVSFALPGKELNVTLGNGVRFSDDGSKIITNRAGYLSYDHASVDVVNIYVVEGSVNRFTGSISFQGDVHVKGDVSTGYSITADGNIVVDGLVEAATIISEKNITIHKGLIGASKAVLAAKENVTTEFIENAQSVEAGNSIYSQLVLNSNLYAMDSIVIEGEGQIIGGRTVAHNRIVCKVAGFKSYVKTELVVGFTKDRLEQMDETMDLIQELKRRNDEVRKSIIFLENKIHGKENDIDQKTLDHDLKEQLMAFSYNNGVLSELQERLALLKADGNQVAKILVSDEILPMVKVRVNHMELLIQDHMKHRCIFADEEEILIIDLDDCLN